MAVDKKNRIKRAVLTWLCVAALASGAVPESFSGYVPSVTMTAAAEDQQTYVSEIDLQQMVNYYNGTTAAPTGVVVSYYDSNGYMLWINQSGTYKLKGSNYINNSYVDVTIRCDTNVEATIICDDVYIKNDYGYCDSFPVSGGVPNNDHKYYKPFYASSGKMTISGNAAVETYFCQTDNYYAPLTYGNVTGSFCTVTYKDANGNTLGRTHYLSGGTYRPADPTAPIGKKFAGWYVGDTEYDFSTPITSDITVTAHYEDSLIKSVALAQTSNVKDEYIEGNTFDPTGLVITVTYEDDRTEDITYNASNTKFSFSPLLTTELATTDNKVTVSYGTAMDGGSNYVVIPITVAAKQLTGIEIKTAPTKTAYIEGNKFDPTGLVITANYDNGKSEDIAYSETSGITFAPTGELTTADTKVTITYGGKTAEQTITVANKQVTDIAIKTAPTKTAYIEGNKFDPTGLVITANYDNGKTEDIAYSETSGITFAPTGELSTADTKVTITYGGKTAEQTITVANKQLTAIAIKTAPTKTAYIEGNKFDPTGLVITASYDNGKSEDIAYSDNSGITFAPTGELTTADNKVTFTYGGKTAEQTITVANKQLSGIAIKTAPTKTAYIEGNKFDPTGLVITASYDNGKSEDIEYSETSGITFEPTGELTTADNKVTFTYGGKNAEQTITVANKQVTDIAIKTAPTKTAYIEGNKFDPTGLVITANYDNGKSEDIEYSDNSGITFAPTGELSTADTKVEITYGGKTAEQTITVSEKQVTDIAIKTAPTKTAYIEGEKFNPAGLVITASYDNGKSVDIEYSETSGITFTPTGELSTADTKVEITYGGKTAAQTITVANKQLSGIAIKTAPTKTKYIEGEKFDPTGLVITASYDNGKSEDIAYSETSGITFAPTGELTTADTKVTITYGGKTAEQEITVAAKQVTGIVIKTAPTKTKYIAGEKFDPTGLVITASYNNSTSEDIEYSETSGITFAPTGELSTADTKVTITYCGKTAEQSITVRKKSSGGGGGGGNRPSTPTEPNNPSIGGSSKSWSDVAADLAKLTNGSETTIQLNGNTTVPVEVIKVIADRDLKVTLVYDSVKSWKTDGAEITTPAAADLSIIATSKLKTDNLRGISGYQFSMNNTNIPTDLEIAFKNEHAGKFANLYKSVDGTLVFVTCAKLGEDGKVILPDVTEKGDYVAMLCEFSDRLGDMNNDGVLSAADASDILKQIISVADGKNPLVADINGDGKVTAADASEILKRIVGLA